uniref:Zinc finger, CCHC-type n=1 Tax=Tanacetum cinerariifolium TaxID=118510 RepID=A0A699J929_TANCI|nr:zinc finger, CCHC-type [Tanacetum cinerariifolium]
MGITITQSHYIEKILKKFKCDDCCSINTSLDPTIKLIPNTGRAVDQLEYSRAISCLMYAMTSTRSDIAYAVRKLSRYTSNLSTHHWHAIIKVLKYLKKTMDYGFSYVGFPSVLKGSSDASWITNSEDHTSTNGWVFLLGGGAISCVSKKQNCITDSIIEAEFIALAAAGKEFETNGHTSLAHDGLGSAECTLVKVSLISPRQRCEGQGGHAAPCGVKGQRPLLRSRCQIDIQIINHSHTTYNSYTLPIKKQGFRVFETIRACGTFHTVQVLHPLAEKVSPKEEGGPQGCSKGYGFVRFGDNEKRTRAMTKINGTYCSSRPTRIGAVTPRKSPGYDQQQFGPQDTFV